VLCGCALMNTGASTVGIRTVCRMFILFLGVFVLYAMLGSEGCRLWVDSGSRHEPCGPGITLIMCGF